MPKTKSQRKKTARTATGEQRILQSLDAVVHSPRVAKVLATVAREVSAALHERSGARLAWSPIPLPSFGRLPKPIASAWIFVLRAGCTTGAERHPNSIQRFMSYRGSADMQVWQDGQWTSNRLTSNPRAKLERRWLSIPMNAWHRPVMSAGDWTVVSFHTAADDKLIEERPSDDENPDGARASRQRYAGRKAR